MRRRADAGITLVELLVALVLLGLLAGSGALALAAVGPAQSSASTALSRAARRSVQERREILVQGESTWVRFLPDGRVLEAPRFPVPVVPHVP